MKTLIRIWLFNDGELCFQQRQSCASFHPQGRIDGRTGGWSETTPGGNPDGELNQQQINDLIEFALSL
jgi:hypothetical protein